MQDMILQQMLFIQLFRVSQEGTEDNIILYHKIHKDVHTTLSITIMFIVAFYTCMYSNKKVVGISTVSRKEHVAAQTREVVATKEVLPQVTGRRTMFFFLFLALNPIMYGIIL